VTAPAGPGGRALAVTAAAVRRGTAGPEQFLRLLTARVGETESESVYTENKLELRRYEPEEPRFETPILVVYALVNRPYVLDLQPDRSVVRHLLEAGFEVYLIDWGEPSRLDQTLGLADYVSRYVDNCVDAVCEAAGAADVHLLGYCMGGTLSVLYAAVHPERVRTLTLLATPVAVGGTGGVLERWAEGFDPETLVETVGNVPAELLATAFAMLDPVENALTKYVRLYENIEDDEFVENFARVERWIRDGVDVPGGVFREFVTGLYHENRLVRGEWSLDGEPVDLAEVGMPVQQVVGEHDHIVPPAASRPLNDAVGSDDERVVEFAGGHVGISVSGRAHRTLWPDVCEWLGDRDAAAGSAGDDSVDPGSESTGDAGTGSGTGDGSVRQAGDTTTDAA
jgi:polyhydroxyalkanoate synthase